MENDIVQPRKMERNEGWKRLYVCRSTLHCAIPDRDTAVYCIPCLYKMFPSGLIEMRSVKGDEVTNMSIKLPPNVRPELCPRSRHGPYSGLYEGDQRILTVGKDHNYLV